MNSNFNFPARFIIPENAKKIKDNTYSIVVEGYFLYPIDSRLPVFRAHDVVAFGECIIIQLAWGENQTTITYELLSLHSSN